MGKREERNKARGRKAEEPRSRSIKDFFGSKSSALSSESASMCNEEGRGRGEAEAEEVEPVKEVISIDSDGEESQAGGGREGKDCGGAREEEHAEFGFISARPSARQKKQTYGNFGALISLKEHGTRCMRAQDGQLLLPFWNRSFRIGYRNVFSDRRPPGVGVHAHSWGKFASLDLPAFRSMVTPVPTPAPAQASFLLLLLLLLRMRMRMRVRPRQLQLQLLLCLGHPFLPFHCDIICSSSGEVRHPATRFLFPPGGTRDLLPWTAGNLRLWKRGSALRDCCLSCCRHLSNLKLVLQHCQALHGSSSFSHRDLEIFLNFELLSDAAQVISSSSLPFSSSCTSFHLKYFPPVSRPVSSSLGPPPFIAHFSCQLHFAFFRNSAHQACGGIPSFACRWFVCEDPEVSAIRRG
eukprot:753154-Hanusia_phi.AAC.5